jgi:hypothetical protein
MMTPQFLTVRRRIVAVLLLLSTVPGMAIAQRKANAPRGADAPSTPMRGVIDGFVSDTNLVPLAGAEISVLRTPTKILTNAGGRFRFIDVAPGPYLLIVKRLGYRPTSAVIDVPSGDTVRLSYTLERAAQGLAAVQITEKKQSLRMLEFEQRKKLAQGEFFTAEDFEKRVALTLPDVLRFSKTMSLTPDNTNNGNLVALSNREGGGIGGYCPMQFLLDGIPLPAGFPMSILPAPRDVAGVEIYSGPSSVPLQFGGADRRCGMVLVWTKDGY